MKLAELVRVELVQLAELEGSARRVRELVQLAASLRVWLVQLGASLRVHVAELVRGGALLRVSFSLWPCWFLSAAHMFWNCMKLHRRFGPLAAVVTSRRFACIGIVCFVANASIGMLGPMSVTPADAGAPLVNVRENTC